MTKHLQPQHVKGEKGMETPAQIFREQGYLSAAANREAVPSNYANQLCQWHPQQ